MEKEKTSISSAKLKKTDTSISVLLMIGILIVANFLSYNIFYRLDLTQNKIYSISSTSKETVSKLDDIVNITAYFSNNLPSQLLGLRQEVGDILEEYSAYSGGKIRLDFVSPDNDESTMQEMAMKGIPQLTFEVVEKDKQQLVAGYMGITVSFGDKTEAIPVIKQNISDLEYQLTTKIKKVISEEVATIAYLRSNNSSDRNTELGAVFQELEELYSILDVDLSVEEPVIDENIKTLIISSPKEAFEESQLRAINNYLYNGGSLIVLQDGVEIGEGLAVSEIENGLDGLLAEYGIVINNDLVADQRSAMASFSQGFFTFNTPYPFWPRISGSSFNQEYTAVAGLDNVVLPWVSSLSIDEEKISKEAVTVLIETTDKSWTQSDNFQIIPNQIPGVSQGLKKHIIALALDGDVKNPYQEEGQSDEFRANLIVVSDSDFAKDSFVGNHPDNRTLFLNLVDILSLDDDLIKIRSKVTTSRPIEKELEDSDKMSLRYLNVFGITAIVVAYGLGRYYSRRRSRFIDEL